MIVNLFSLERNFEKCATVRPASIGLDLLILLLAAPTWLWGRCGRHNSPPASSDIDFIFCRSDGSQVSRLTQSIHLCFGLPRFLLPGGTISRVFLPS